MRKEIIGIFCFFLVIFTLISLLSFSPDDPSIHNAKAGGEIHNLFGLLGAHLAGILIGLFGLGAFWIPLLLLLTSIHFFGDHPTKAKISIGSPRSGFSFVKKMLSEYTDTSLTGPPGGGGDGGVTGGNVNWSLTVPDPLAPGVLTVNQGTLTQAGVQTQLSPASDLLQLAILPLSSPSGPR